jgi:hypothetical protein
LLRSTLPRFLLGVAVSLPASSSSYLALALAFSSLLLVSTDPRTLDVKPPVPRVSEIARVCVAACESDRITLGTRTIESRWEAEGGKSERRMGHTVKRLYGIEDKRLALLLTYEIFKEREKGGERGEMKERRREGEKERRREGEKERRRGGKGRREKRT